ncbi:MAG: hypothetical protein WC649_07350 [Desulfobacteria bacterium]
MAKKNSKVRDYRHDEKRKTMSINKHAGVIRLSEDPVSFQRRMREEWT